MNRDDETALFELADVILAVSRHINSVKENLAEPGTPLEGAVMRYIDRHPGTTAGDVSQATRLISSNTSRAIRSLVQRGLVRRESDPSDARRALLYPTKTAAANLKRLRTIWSRLLDGTIDDRDERDAVIATLRRLERRLLEGAAPGGVTASRARRPS